MIGLSFRSGLLTVSSSIKIHHVRWDIWFVWSLLILFLKWFHCTITACGWSCLYMCCLRNKISRRSFDWTCGYRGYVFCRHRVWMTMDSMFNEIVSWSLKFFDLMSLSKFFKVSFQFFDLASMLLFNRINFIHQSFNFSWKQATFLLFLCIELIDRFELNLNSIYIFTCLRQSFFCHIFNLLVQILNM